MAFSDEEFGLRPRPKNKVQKRKESVWVLCETERFRARLSHPRLWKEPLAFRSSKMAFSNEEFSLRPRPKNKVQKRRESVEEVPNT